MTLLQAQQAYDKAVRSFRAAKTESARSAALDVLSKAGIELGRAQALSGAARAEEPPMKTEEEEEDDEPKKPLADDEEEHDSEDSMDSEDSDSSEEEEESMDDEDSEEEDESMEENDSEDSADSDSEDSGDSEEEEDEEEEDEEARAQAVLAARTLYSAAKRMGSKKLSTLAAKNLRAAKKAAKPKTTAKHKALSATVAKVTGKRRLNEQLGALEALPATKAQLAKLSADTTALKKAGRKQRVTELLAANREKFGPGEKAGLIELGLEKGTSWLRSHLEARPKLVRTTVEGPVRGALEASAPQGSATESKIPALNELSPDQLRIITEGAASAGMSVDKFYASVSKRGGYAGARAPSRN